MIDLDKIIKTGKSIYIVNTEDDLPTPTDTGSVLGVCHILTSGYIYFFGQNITLQYPIVLNNNELVSYSPISITYAEPGALFRNNSTYPIGVSSLTKLAVVGNGTNTLFDITSAASGQGNALSITNMRVTNFHPGTITNTDNFFIAFSTFALQKSTLTLDAVTTTFMDAIAFVPLAQISDALITITNTPANGVVDCLNFRAFPISGDSIFNITSFSGRAALGNIFLINSLGGIDFKSGSLDHTSPEVKVIGSPNIPDSQIIGSMYMERNATVTTITAAGVTVAFTGVEDAGSGKSRILTGTTPTDGSTVLIDNDYYAGTYVTSNTVLNTSFEIVKAYGGTETGNWENNWVEVAGTTIAGENERASMTGNNEITMSNLESVQVNVTGITNPRNNLVAAGKNFEFCIAKNGARVKGTLKGREMTDKLQEGGMNGTTSVITGDVFKMLARNITDTTDLVMENMSVVIKK